VKTLLALTLAAAIATGLPATAASAPAPAITRVAVVFGPLTSAATLTVCGRTGPLRIQRSSKLVSLDDPSVVYGRDSASYRRTQRQRCQTHRVSWSRTPEFSGSGIESVQIAVIDRTGRRSPIVQRRDNRSD
jgi:hypothetical protein